MNFPDVLSVKDRIDVEGPEWKKAIYKWLRVVVEGFNGRVRAVLPTAGLVAGAGERLDSRGPRSDGCLRGLYSRLWPWEA